MALSPTSSRGGSGLGSVTLTGTPAAGQAIVATGAAAATWQYPPGYQLDYVEITSSVTIAATTDGNNQGTAVIDGNAVTFDGSTVVFIEFFTPFVSMTPGAAGRTAYINLYDGTTDLGRFLEVDGPVNAVNSRAGQYFRRRITPSAAAHTYHVRAWKDAAGDTASVLAGAGGASTVGPAYYRIVVA